MARLNQESPETYADLEIELELETEVDKVGRIHARKSTSETEVQGSIFMGASLAAAGLFLVKYHKKMTTGFGVLMNYALLMHESRKS